MSSFFLMFPYYLLGNFHCLGMCGPLVMMLGKHRYRDLYFLGRTASFTLAALVAAGFGALLSDTLSTWHLSALLSLLFGFAILLFAIAGNKLPAIKVPFIKQNKLTALILQDTPFATFLFGFSTVFLPCGQTLIVFSYCALLGDPLLGAFNGFFFALLTSPSLFFAMRARALIQNFGKRAELAGTVLALLVGTLAILRGFAELEIIPHLTLSSKYHIILY